MTDPYRNVTNHFELIGTLGQLRTPAKDWYREVDWAKFRATVFRW